MTLNVDSPPKKSRLLRYSLRSFFIVLTVCCVVLGYWAYRAERQRAVVKWVEEKGGFVYYDFESLDDGDIIPNAKSPVPNWVRLVLDDNYFCSVNHIGFEGGEVKDIAPLAKLSDLRFLVLSDIPVTDLSPLAGMPNLRMVMLDNTKIADLSALANKKLLRSLFIGKMPARDLKPLSGLTNLRQLVIVNQHVDDPTPLMNLKRLEQLYLLESGFTPDQIKRLQASLPDCQID